MKIKKGILIGILIAVCLAAMSFAPRYIEERQKDNNRTDAAALRSVIAEAFLNIQDDPDFVNTATKGHPMEIPDKYYTYVESVQGDGRVHVIMYYENTLDAYFGTPEKNMNYYLGYSLYSLPE